MGRKIPGKKHKTVKDPYKQKQKRLDRIREKVDNPPSNPKEQEIPKSLYEIMKLKDEAKRIVTKKCKKRKKGPVVLSMSKLIDKDPIPKGMTKPDRYIPNLTQKPNESVVSFLGRITSMTQNLINEVEFEKKFGVEIQKNSETGEVVEVKKIKKERKSKKKKLSEKRKEKINKKKENLKNIKDFSLLKDIVEYGEVVHRPPDLPKIKKPQSEVQKPKYGNLVLSGTLKNNHEHSKKLETNFEKEKKESERKFIVEAYRKVRKRKAN